jgi:hypothetical protein
MRSSWHAGLIITLLCLLIFIAASGVPSAEEKRIMIAVTADTQGEINPCG